MINQKLAPLKSKRPAQNMQEYAVVFGLIIVIAIPIIGAVASNVVGMLGGMIGNRQSEAPILISTVSNPADTPTSTITPNPTPNNGTMDGSLSIEGGTLLYSKDPITGQIQLMLKSPNGESTNVASSDGTVINYLAKQIDQFLQKNEAALNLPENATLKTALMNLKKYGLTLSQKQQTFGPGQSINSISGGPDPISYKDAHDLVKGYLSGFTKPDGLYHEKLIQMDPQLYATVFEAGNLIENISFYNFYLVGNGASNQDIQNTNQKHPFYPVQVAADAGAEETAHQSERVGDVAEQIPAGAG